MRNSLWALVLLCVTFSVVAQTQIQLRRGTTAEWTLADPVLAEGEVGVDLTTDCFRVGDGVLAWSALPDFACVGGGGGMAGFTVAGDSGGGQSITDGNTISLLGGTAITTADSVTDTVTFNVDVATLEPLLSLQNLGGAVTDAQVPDRGLTITGIAGSTALDCTGATTTVDLSAAGSFSCSSTADTTLAVSNAPTPPEVSQVVLYITASGADRTVDLATGWYARGAQTWPITVTNGSLVEIQLSTTPAGDVVGSYVDMVVQ